MYSQQAASTYVANFRVTAIDYGCGVYRLVTGASNLTDDALLQPFALATFVENNPDLRILAAVYISGSGLTVVTERR